MTLCGLRRLVLGGRCWSICKIIINQPINRTDSQTVSCLLFCAGAGAGPPVGEQSLNPSVNQSLFGRDISCLLVGAAPPVAEQSICQSASQPVSCFLASGG
mmetsp:Transcript_7322/g.14924  ORF Transcript_7322/g.14924 Transcript_7322/m.14924 type:complete len:101 (+) Transcript_7322:814-1116(+)